MLYFAYGMNTNDNAMPGAARLGKSTLLNYSWEMLQYANVYDNYRSNVSGILWDINEDTLKYLDVREGYPDFYNRILTDVEHDGVTKQAWVYYMTDYYREKLKDTTPSDQYLASVVAGYAANGLPLPTSSL
jgi:gamma-glutamylcyclotransferase (GGCT)/AIG2-like uncharacterized protein YtfP